MRVGSIDVCKFIFALVICFYHFGEVISPNKWFPMGNVAVELFVLISGIFFFYGWEKTKEKYQCINKEIPSAELYIFTKKRFLRFLPYTTLAFLFSASVRGIPFVKDGTLFENDRILKWISNDVWELLLVKMNGLNNGAGLLNVPAWTISALFIVEIVIFAFLINWEKAFKSFITPCTLLVGFGLWTQIESTSYRLWIGFTTFGVLRVFILTCLSFYCCKLIDAIKNIAFTTTGKIVMSLCEMSLYAFSLYLIMHFNNRPFRFLTILVLFFAVAISMSRKSYSDHLFSSCKYTNYLGELSLGIYLMHYPIYKVFKSIWPNPIEMLDHTLEFIILVIAFASLLLFAVRVTKRFFGLLENRIKTMLIIPND